MAWLADDHPVARHWGAYGLFLTRFQSTEIQEALKKTIANDAMAANRVMAAQALGLCGDPAAAFEAVLKEARTTKDDYVFLFALNAFQYSHTDIYLTREHWEEFREKQDTAKPEIDPYGFDYAGRIINDAIDLWPARRRVD